MAETFTSNPGGGRQPPHPQPQPYPHCLQQPPPPIYPNPSNPRTNLLTSPFLRAFAAGMILILIVAIIVYAVEYLIFRPVLPAFRVDSLHLSNFSVAAAPQSLSALWVVGFSVNNPNKKLTISYGNIESSIYYKTRILSQARIHHFNVRKWNQTAVITPFVANSPADASVLNDINGDLARGFINFTVTVLGRVRFENGVWRWRGNLCRVLCSDLAVGISPPLSYSGGYGELVGGSRQCQVR